MAGVTTTSTVSGQFQAYFSDQLLKNAVQETVLEQFADKAPIPKNAGNKSITLFRYGNPSIADIQSLTEGTSPANSTASQLSVTSITKSLTQHGTQFILTDILRATDLLHSGTQATKRISQDLKLWTDSVCRNVLLGSNLTASNGSIGSAQEGGGSLDNSDTLTEVYGQPATVTQSYTGLNSATTDSVANAATLLDLMTKAKRNRAPEINGGYVYIADPRTARDLMRDSDWLNASNYGNAGRPLYNGEVGSLYGCRVVVQTNSFVSLGSATAGDRFIYATSGGGGTGTGKDIIVNFLMGAGAFGVPQLAGGSPFSPSIEILNQADKSDPYNQRVHLAAKIYWTALRQNCNYYIIHRTKTNHTL